MSVIIPPGYGLAALVLDGPDGTGPFVTTIGVSLSQVGGDFIAAANAIMEAYGETIMPDTSDALSLTKCVLSVGQDGPGGSVESDRLAYTGENTGPIAPLAMSAIGRKATAQIGRGGRGRMFLPGSIDETGVDEGGYLTLTVQTGWTANMEAFREYLEAVPGGSPVPAVPPVLLHSDERTPTPITSISCAPQVGWIRKRIR